MRQECRALRKLKLRCAISRKTRDKETYFVQRNAIGKIEFESINKYILATEAKFERNWKSYEEQLHKYLTQQKKSFPDWLECKRQDGTVFWTNQKTF